MSRFLRLVLVASALIVSSSATPLSTNPDARARHSPLSLAPLIASEHPHGTLNNSYIIVLKDNVSEELKVNHFNFLQALHTSNPLVGEELSGVQRVYEGIHGYSGRFAESVIEQLRTLPEVDYIERDQIVRTQGVTQQTGAPWVGSSS
jgi:cerevisin